MKIKILFLLFLFLGLFSEGKQVLKNDSIKKGRVILVSSSLLGALSSSYLYIENSWWNEKQQSFHFDNGSDKVYALNVDKAGHFMGGLQAADVFSGSMRWAGMRKKQSLWYGAAFGSALQLAIEMKDAYAPYWGFSKWDLAIGSTGAFLPVIKYYSPTLNAIDIKLSYWKRHNTYWDLEAQRGKTPNKYAWQDDYVNQSYWLSVDLNYFNNNIPDWLNIAIGFGLDETQYLNSHGTKMGGNNEWYIALDYDIPKLLKKWNSPTAKKVKHWLNYFHFPAPTIRISPKTEFYPLFL
ncbi:MAG: DUF2279 domain-containing protein [Flavobacteriales bacterium]|nr:DUF2279 domain-containing protein [Flavobacteriales bacterium]